MIKNADIGVNAICKHRVKKVRKSAFERKILVPFFIIAEAEEKVTNIHGGTKFVVRKIQISLLTGFGLFQFWA